MDNMKPTAFANYAILSLFAFASLSLCFWSLYTTNSFTLLTEYRHCRTNSTAINDRGDELEQALSRASMANKTVIIAMINKAYSDQMNNAVTDRTMLDTFLDGFWIGEETRSLIDHVVIVAMDRTAYERCRFLRLNCLRFETEGMDFREEKLYMSPDFINMMWRRTWLLLQILKRGYSFIFTDTDVVWLRNPFKKLSSNPSIDLQISTDFFNGDPNSTSNPINTGFYLTRSNNRTIALFQKWYDSRNSSKAMKEQDVLQRLIRHGIFSKLRLQVSFLNTVFFSGFCQDSTDAGSVVTVHANCCRSIEAKAADLRNVIRDWKKIRKVASNRAEMADFRWSAHRSCADSWKNRSSVVATVG